MRIEDITSDDGRRGFVANIDRDEYTAITRLNPSSITKGLVGVSEFDPRLVKAEFEGERSPPAANAQDRMDRGTLAHMAILQPERLASDVAVWSGERRSGKDWDAFESENEGKLILKQSDYRSVMQTVGLLMRQSKMLNRLVSSGTPETAIFSQRGAIMLKGMVDLIDVDARVIVDIKTTEAGIDHSSVHRTIRSLHYREKMAVYRYMAATETGTHVEDWRCWNLFLRLGEYPAVRQVQMPSDALEWGWERASGCIDAVARCIESKSWPLFEQDDFMDVAMWEVALVGEDIDYGE